MNGTIIIWNFVLYDENLFSLDRMSGILSSYNTLETSSERLKVAGSQSKFVTSWHIMMHQTELWWIMMCFVPFCHCNVNYVLSLPRFYAELKAWEDVKVYKDRETRG